jgi:hypothetical protein
MVKKAWNLISLKKITNQDIKIKNKIAVRIVSEKPEPDIILTHIDLGKDKEYFHKITFYLNVPNNKSFVCIKVFDPDKKLLAEGKSSADSLILNFCSTAPWVSIEIKGFLDQLNTYYYLLRVIQESYSEVPIDPSLESLLESEGTLNLSWDDLPKLSLWSCLTKIPGLNAHLHKELLMKNRGEVLLKSLHHLESSREIAMILSFLLRINDHYRGLSAPNSQTIHHQRSKDIVAENLKYKEQYLGLIESVNRLLKKITEVDESNKKLTEERQKFISRIHFLSEKILPELKDDPYYQQILKKIDTLSSIKDYLIKDLLKQNTYKQMLEELLASSSASSSAAAASNVRGRVILERFNKGIINLYNIIGKDLLDIDAELQKNQEIKKRLMIIHNERRTNNPIVEEINGLKKKVKELTDTVNNNMELVVHMNNQIEMYNLQKWSVFHLYLENIIEDKLAKVYEKN